MYAQKAGYAPATLADFLTRLAERNKNQAERNGLFASHPETKERIDKSAHRRRRDEGRHGDARYKQNIKYTAVPITSIAAVEGGSTGLTGSEGAAAKDDKSKAKAEAPKKGGFGAGALKQTVAPEKQSAQVSASGGSRGLGPDRAAKGGGNPALVRVAAISDAELATFRKALRNHAGRPEGRPLQTKKPAHAGDEGLRGFHDCPRLRSRFAMAFELGTPRRDCRGDALHNRRVGQHDAPEGVRADLQQLAIVDGDDRRAARVAGQQRHLAEDRPSRSRATSPSVCASVTDASPRSEHEHRRRRRRLRATIVSPAAKSSGRAACARLGALLVGQAGEDLDTRRTTGRASTPAARTALRPARSAPGSGRGC